MYVELSTSYEIDFHCRWSRNYYSSLELGGPLSCLQETVTEPWRTTIMFTRDSHWTLTLNSVQIFAPLISKDFVTSLMLTVNAKWPSPSWYTARNSACISRLSHTWYMSQHSHSPWFDVAENVNYVTQHYSAFTSPCLLGWHILLSIILTLFTQTEREDFIPVQKTFKPVLFP